MLKSNAYATHMLKKRRWFLGANFSIHSVPNKTDFNKKLLLPQRKLCSFFRV